MATRTATASDYQALLLDQQNQSQTVTDWYNAFVNPLYNQYNSVASGYEQQASYDISQAYSAYKKQNRSVTGLATISSEIKNQISRDLESAYSTEAASIKQNEASNIGKAASYYGNAINEAYQNTAKNLSSFETALMGFGSSKLEAGWDNGLYNVDESGASNLTEYGREVLDRLLHSEEFINDNSFETYLRSELKNEDLADWYVNNAGLVNELTAGLEANDFNYTADDRYRTKASEVKTEYSKLEGADTSKTFDTFQEEYEYYTNAIAETGRAQREKLDITGSKGFEYKGKTYYTTDIPSDSKLATFQGIGGPNYTSVESAAQKYFKNKTGKQAEIITYDGNDYIYSKGKWYLMSTSKPKSGSSKGPSSSMLVSDVRLKKDFDDITFNINQLNSLPIKTFDYTIGDDRERQVGIMAQDAEKAFGDNAKLFIHIDENGQYWLKENKLIYVLMDVLKQQQKEIDKLKKGE